MAIFCKSCLAFRGSIRTCRICSLPFCSDCRASINLCKDCFIETHCISEIEIYKDVRVENDMSFV